MKGWREKEEYRILIKVLRTDLGTNLEQIWNYIYRSIQVLHVMQPADNIYGERTVHLILPGHGQTSVHGTKPGPSFQL
jgi:hypothetical protein